MPLFKPKPGSKGSSSESAHQSRANGPADRAQHNGSRPAEKPADSSVSRPNLVFHCQQAQGSPTGLISGFSNVRELYQKIAECYEFPPEDVSNISTIPLHVHLLIRIKETNTVDLRCNYSFLCCLYKKNCS